MACGNILKSKVALPRPYGDKASCPSTRSKHLVQKFRRRIGGSMWSLIGTLVVESGDRLNPESSALDVESVEI